MSSAIYGSTVKIIETYTFLLAAVVCIQYHWGEPERALHNHECTSCAMVCTVRPSREIYARYGSMALDIVQTILMRILMPRPRATPINLNEL